MHDFFEKVKKIIEINWLEIFYLNQIKNEIDNKLDECKEDNAENDYERKIREENDFDNNLKLKFIYNNKVLLKMKKNRWVGIGNLAPSPIPNPH